MPPQIEKHRIRQIHRPLQDKSKRLPKPRMNPPPVNLWTPPPQLLPSLTMKRRVETASLLNPFALPSKLTTKSFVVLRRPHAFHLLHFCPSPWQIPTWRSPSHDILNEYSIGEVWIRKSTSHLNGKHWWSGTGESISKLLDGCPPTAQAANEAHSCVYPIRVTSVGGLVHCGVYHR